MNPKVKFQESSQAHPILSPGCQTETKIRQNKTAAPQYSSAFFRGATFGVWSPDQRCAMLVVHSLEREVRSSREMVTKAGHHQ
jgi:hypothetical protein